MPTRLRDLVEQTPPSRERYVDLLRALSIAVVVLGHWTMAVIQLRDGTWQVTNLLAEVRWLWPATWLLQVMPVFFFVGGFANMAALDAAARRGEGYAHFATARTWRLMKPVLVLLGVWLPLVTAAQSSGRIPLDLLRSATTVVSQPLWFIGIYLIVTALAPPMRRLHRRWGWRVPVALAAGAALVDVLRFGELAGAGNLNFGFVWLFAHQLGFFYADGSLRRMPRTRLLVMVAAGLGGLWALTTLGPYPRSMVGLPGESVSNMNPPTLCLVALATWQVALAMVVRDRATRWLMRDRPWGMVIAANRVIMTTFLWHLTALLIVAAIVLPRGFPQPEAGSAAWWLTRIPWIVMLLLITTALVAGLGRFERPALTKAQSPASHATLAAALGTAAVIVATCGFAVSGLADFASPNGRTLLGVPVSPLMNLVMLAAGGILFQLSRSRVRRTESAGPA